MVGAGAAGAVIASRVTERPDRQVLLLEAGPDYGDPAALPPDLADGRRNSMRRHDWGLTHRPSSVSVRLPYPRGRVVGGSSAVNTCIALRGMPYDYDAWAEEGLPEWSWERCLPAFKRLENDMDHTGGWHGNGGPLPLRRHRTEELPIWQAAFLEACDHLGLPRCTDTNDPTQTGAGFHAMNRVEGRRVSAAEAWLTPEVRARDNLTISPHTLVRRVLFHGRRASGVEVERGGEVTVLPAGRVVLCAGAIHTPGILLRSGVGPRDELTRLGVEPVAHVPAVGARLLDHPGTALFFWPRTRHPEAPLIMTALRWSPEGEPRRNTLTMQPGSSVPLPWVNLPLVSIMLMVGKPEGSGFLRWPSADPRARPIIRPGLMDHPADLARAVQGLQRARELAATPAMAPLARHLWPGRRAMDDPERLGRWIRRRCDSGYHPCGTVPMGPEGSDDAAVDGRGRVRGVQGLRVADASLMPSIPSSNTHLPTLMIGERFGVWLSESAD